MAATLAAFGGIVASTPADGATSSAEATVVGAVNSAINRGSAHVALEGGLSVVGSFFPTATGSGVLDFTKNLTEIDGKAPGFGSGPSSSLSIIERFHDQIVYAMIPVTGTPPGKTWVALSLSSRNAGSVGASALGVAGGVPIDPIAVLRAIGRRAGSKVLNLGPSILGNQTVNAYAVSFAAAGPGSRFSIGQTKHPAVDFKIYLAGDNSLAGLSEAFTVTLQGQSDTVIDMLGFNDYGVPVSVKLPPRREVATYSSHARELNNDLGVG